MRRAVLVAVVLLLTLEALLFAAVGWVMGLAVRSQHMSIAGLSTDAMAIGAWAGQGLLALFLLLCAALAARAALRTGPPGRPTRALLTACAVLHGVLGAVLLSLIGVAVFLAMVVLMGLLVFALLLLAEPAPAPDDLSAGTPPPLPPAVDGPVPA